MTQSHDRFGDGGLNDDISIDELLAQLDLDAEEIAWRKDFVGFDDDDVARLAELEDQLAERADALANRFYERLISLPQTETVIDRSSKSIDELEETQKAYLQTLVEGEYEREYFANRARIGKLHELLDMPMKHYIGQYTVYYDLFLSVLEERMYERLSETVQGHPAVEDHAGAELVAELLADVETGCEEMGSVLKLLNLDMQIAVDTYLQSHIDELKLERDRFAALFENVPTPVVAVRVDGGRQCVEHVNPSFEKLFGVTAEDLQDEPFEEALRPPGAEPQPIEDRTFVDPHGMTSDHELTKAEVTLETKFGRRDFIRVSAPIDREELDDIEYAFYMDVTDQKQRQERIQVLGRVLRHDIRNQMQVIHGYATLLKAPDEDRSTAHLADQIENASEELLSMADKVRNVERVISGTANRHPIDVEATIESVVSDLRERYPECTFSWSVPGPMWIEATDAVRIALENVVENAAEHNDADEPEVDIRAFENPSKSHVHVQVRDNGPGIPQSEYEILTGKRERSQIDHASGIGLWIVNWIVTKLGGTLHFERNAPRGSVITLRLPQSNPKSN